MFVGGRSGRDAPGSAPGIFKDMRMSRFFLLLAGLAMASPAVGQSVDVPFRYIPAGVVENAFVPGSFNSWGQPYTGGNACIAAGHEAQMSFVRFENYWIKRVPLVVGQTYEYKIQVHRNVAGTDCNWFSDPLNPEINAGNNDNSVLVVTDPMVFQLAEEVTADGLVRFMSASLVSTEDIVSIDYTVNGVAATDGLTHYDPASGVFRFQLVRELRTGAQLRIDATDAQGRTMTAEIGALQPPVEWTSQPFTTVDESARLKAFITRLDGSVDPGVTGAQLFREGGGQTFVPVASGVAEAVATLEMGENTFRLEAVVEGQTFTSDPITVTRRLHPLEAFAVEPTVSGAGFGFEVTLNPTALLPGTFDVAWSLDEGLSTSGASSWTGSGLTAAGTADGPGELYFDVDITSGGERIDQLRVAVLVEEDGTSRQMTFAENASWVKQAVVYEIFALKFGPTSSGTVANPSIRFRQITDELDYIAGMGFNTIWFMPIMRNRNGMTAIGAGYNIIDFKAVDERLGSADDFRALVARAHELGIRVVLDLTPSHASPDHPWVNSLREGGAFSDYIQTTPSAHNRGQDGRGANLPEIWQVENGENLYRKYDGFGDLANLNWDDNDLQAEMLDVMSWWLTEFDVDGYRMDVWWGPTRRYGAERFARPVRETIKRVRPDAWILGEIAGTGSSTEVYYTDADNGAAVTGGLDAGYDWNFYHQAIRGDYGATNTYNFYAKNNNFYPGPNARYFRFLENHDELRIAYTHRNNPGRLKPLAGFLLTTTGIPMVYAGQEVGFGASGDFSRRDPVDWEVEGNGDLARLYQKLSFARAQFPAFGTQILETVHTARSGEPRVYAFARPFLDENAVVAINFEAEPIRLTIDPSSAVQMSNDGPIPYYDVFADTSASYLGEFSVTIPAFGTAVYITSDDPGYRLPDLPQLPYGAVYTGNESVVLPGRVSLEPNYPNPFNPRTRIVFDLPSGMPVRLAVFDILGRRVALLSDGVMTAGRHEVDFDASGLPSGTYLYRLEAGGQAVTRAMALIR
jgi:glycosidase